MSPIFPEFQRNKKQHGTTSVPRPFPSCLKSPLISVRLIEAVKYHLKKLFFSFFFFTIVHHNFKLGIALSSPVSPLLHFIKSQQHSVWLQCQLEQNISVDSTASLRIKKHDLVREISSPEMLYQWKKASSHICMSYQQASPGHSAVFTSDASPPFPLAEFLRIMCI
ncbi:hypothetical protein NPIL_496261 [Nephila pilipes]|uniref:Uncharacterized protein n=1 Tax=Nephila pilipes TaxID=299642 RepID=A0A8X6PWP6_NEPPI|nr:hypothetical protein NPIL_496261 [Nephila pilipes]